MEYNFFLITVIISIYYYLFLEHKEISPSSEQKAKKNFYVYSFSLIKNLFLFFYDSLFICFYVFPSFIFFSFFLGITYRKNIEMKKK